MCFEPIKPKKGELLSDHDLIWNVQQGRCYYCDTPMEHKMQHSWVAGVTVPKRSSTIEHLHRRVDGGKNNLNNKRLACYICNGNRGNRDWCTYRGFPDGNRQP